MPKKRTYVERVCARCEQRYRVRSDAAQQQKYCGANCRTLASRRFVPENWRACQRCGKPVYAPPSEVALGKGATCSRACRFGSDAERFLSFVERSEGTDGCWRWTGTVISAAQPYGRFSVNGKLMLAHRYAWTLAHGEIPAGLLVLHRCPGGGNPWCVNPGHLAVGTHHENTQDIVDQGRHWSQTGTWGPKRRERPSGVVGDMRELTVIMPRTLHRRLVEMARSEGRSLQEIALAALAAL